MAKKSKKTTGAKADDNALDPKQDATEEITPDTIETGPDADTVEASAAKIADAARDGDAASATETALDAAEDASDASDTAPQSIDDASVGMDEMKDDASAEIPAEVPADETLGADDTLDGSAPSDEPPVGDAAALENIDQDTIEDAVILDEDTLTGDVPADALADETAQADTEPAADVLEETRAEEPRAEPTPVPAPPPPPQEAPSVFMPMLFGGLVAAGIGFALARFVIPDGWPIGSESAFEQETRSALASQGEAIAALEGNVPDGVVTEEALAAVEARIGSVEGSVSASLGDVQSTLTALQDSVSAFDARLTEIEKRPVTEAVSEEAIAAYERELATLQESIVAQRAEIEAIAEEAVSKENEAADMAQAALARAAITRVISALDSGAPFEAALADYEAAGGTEVPEALASVADTGVATLSTLQEGFPDVARAALATAREADASDGAGGLGTFFARQLGARSVTPREGSDPDAVLSRAEAAVRNGQLGDAIAEIETLPEAAKSALGSWRDIAVTRQDAVSAAEALAQRLSGS